MPFCIQFLIEFIGKKAPSGGPPGAAPDGPVTHEVVHILHQTKQGRDPKVPLLKIRELKSKDKPKEHEGIQGSSIKITTKLYIADSNLCCVLRCEPNIPLGTIMSLNVHLGVTHFI